MDRQKESFADAARKCDDYDSTLAVINTIPEKV
jgi:hypothetical protein